MAGQHGGYRRPTNPAPVSGPGQHSRRTDNRQPVMQGAGDGSYGAEQAMEQIQAGAPMAQAATPMMPSGTPQAGAGAPNPLDSVIPMGAPSQQPGTPVTDGAAAGPGQGPGALGIPDPNRADAAFYARYLPALVPIADDPNTAPGFRAWVRMIIANQ